MMTLEDKLEEYRVIKNDLATLKKDEMDLRIVIAEELSAEGLAAGTHNFDFPGMKVKIVSKLNYKIDKEILEGVYLSEEEAECVRWKPEIDLKKYKQAEDTDSLDEAVIITTGVPTLTVELSE